MGSANILDFERLWSPIAADNPCGADLRWDLTYHQIKEARPKDDRDAFGLSDAQPADWGSVVDLTVDALATKSKDFMIACWLTEALTHVHGFAGVRDGLKLINGLAERYWDTMYPLPEGDDWEPRAAPFVFLTAEGRGARLAITLRESPLTPDREVIYSLNYWGFRQQIKGESVEAFQRRATEVEEKTRQFDEAVSRAPVAFYKDLFEDIEEGKRELQRLGSQLDEKLGDFAPAAASVRGALEDCYTRVRIIYKDKGGFDATDDGAQDSGGVHAGGNGQARGRASGPISSREEAFNRLAEVAAFLRQKEPQSPIYLLVERAVSWSRMPFDQLLGELIKDAGTRGQVSELLGIKEPPV